MEMIATKKKKKATLHSRASLPPASILNAHHPATNRVRSVRRLFLLSASAAAMLALSTGSASAQWTGAINNDWTVAGNWTGGVVPASPSQVTISPASGNPAVLGVNGAAAGSSGSILVGLSGVGNLTIQNGSTLTSSGTFLNIGRNSGSNGTVTVTGAGSHWTTSTSALIVGLSGTGTLNILHGGTVTAQNGVTVGSQAAGSGTLNISGGGVLETTILQGGTGARQVNFDGGTVRALAGNVNFMNLPSNIGAGGLTLDTNGFTIGVRDIGGVGGLTIIGNGTVQLASGANTYIGETWIQNGSTLRLTFGTISSSSRVIADGTFSLVGAAANAGTIQSLAGNGSVVTAAGRNLILTNANDTFFGDITGGGNVRVTGGTQTLSGANNYTGATTVNGGTLRAGSVNTFSAASAFSVLLGTLDLAGFNQTLASLDNAGTVNLGGAPGTVLTVAGNYVGNGGTFNLNATLGGDASPTNRLVVGGDTSGASSLRVTNVGGAGAQTVEGIKVVDVAGASNGSFALIGDYVFHGEQAVIGGAYAYVLQKNGVGDPTDGDWYLRSALINPPPDTPAGPLYQPGVPVYEAYAQVLLGLNALSTMRERIGDRARAEGDAFASFGPPVETQSGDGSAWWARTEGWKSHVEPKNSTAGASYDTNNVRLQTGLDFMLRETASGRLLAGLYLQYGHSGSDIRSFFGNGTIDVDGYSIAGTLTWLGSNGFYVDGQAQVTLFDSALRSITANTDLVKGNDAQGYALSVESGWRVPVGAAWSLIPQAQLMYSAVHFNDFADTFGAAVSLDDGESLIGRGGAAAEYRTAWRDPARGLASAGVYGIANLYYEFLDGTQTNVANIAFASAQDRLWGGLGIGGNYSWRDGKYTLFAEGLATTSLDNFSDSYAYRGTAGFKARW